MVLDASGAWLTPRGIPPYWRGRIRVIATETGADLTRSCVAFELETRTARYLVRVPGRSPVVATCPAVIEARDPADANDWKRWTKERLALRGTR